MFHEIADELENGILRYWLSLQDPRGGFYGEVDASGRIEPDAPRGVILNARIIWAFSAAYGMSPKPAYLQAARRAADWFVAHFCDPENGGVYWSVTAEGERLDDKKQLYAQGFAIFFDDDDTTTAIDAVETAATANDNAPYYSLQGVRYAGKPAAGIYIHNGKKVIIK